MALIFLFAGLLWAEPPELQFAKDLARAHSAAEVDRVQTEYSRRKIADTACRVELREHSAPVSCYEALALEKPAPESALKAARVKHLNRLCALAADSLRTGEPSAYVSAECAKSLASSHEIQKYREDEGADWSNY
jgi:hypothetical protein